MSERDTQFAGFARLLFDELYNNDDMFFDTADPHWHEDWQKIIARRAYDLACHVATHTVLTAYGDRIKIPDMTTLPEVSCE